MTPSHRIHARGPLLDWTLFLAAFVSSTLLPGGSEALLLLKLHDGGDPFTLVLVATAGNLLGSILTYAMGRAGNALLRARRLFASEAQIERAERLFRRWGLPSLLFAWLPLLGDPLCLLAGLLRVSAPVFVVLVGIGKLARYAVVAWLIS